MTLSNSKSVLVSMVEVGLVEGTCERINKTMQKGVRVKGRNVMGGKKTRRRMGEMMIRENGFMS